MANATCEKGVSKKIKQSENLNESDRDKLIGECRKFQDYRQNLDKIILPRIAGLLIGGVKCSPIVKEDIDEGTK